jgi:hypothetical protein
MNIDDWHFIKAWSETGHAINAFGEKAIDLCIKDDKTHITMRCTQESYDDNRFQYIVGIRFVSHPCLSLERQKTSFTLGDFEGIKGTNSEFLRLDELLDLFNEKNKSRAILVFSELAEKMKKARSWR